MPAQLDYDLIPPTDPAHPAVRWVVVLHGLGDSKNGWKPVAGELDLPDTGWIFVQAPDAYYDGWSWFDLRLPDPRPDLSTVHRSRTMLRELLAQLEKERGIPCERIVLMGFSQGCLMALNLALAHERRFVGVIGISGWIAEMEIYPGGFGVAAVHQQVLMTHGVADQVIPIQVTRPQVKRLQGLGLELEWKEYRKAHHIDPEGELADIREFIVGLAVPAPGLPRS